MELLIQTWILSRKSGHRPGTVALLPRSEADKLEAEGVAQVMVGREMREMKVPEYDEGVEPLVVGVDLASKPDISTRAKVVSPEDVGVRSKRKNIVPLITASRPRLVKRT